LKIKVYYDGVTTRIRGSGAIKSLIGKVIRSENRTPGDLDFIMTDDRRILEINKEFLSHDYFTDVIAFNYNKGKTVNGEIYISTDTVRSNATNYKVSFNYEILRVMIHAVLHLCGYSDSTGAEKERMRELEDFWLGKL